MQRKSHQSQTDTSLHVKIWNVTKNKSTLILDVKN